MQTKGHLSGSRNDNVIKPVNDGLRDEPLESELLLSASANFCYKVWNYLK